MTFDEYCEKHIDEFKKCFPGVIGLAINNWLYNDWLVEFHRDIWLANQKQIDENTKDWLNELIERKEKQNGNKG